MPPSESVAATRSGLSTNVLVTSGFTLIELSIVLVIVGLLAGGVLVGQDLIKAATIRSQISQIEKYNTAVNTFRIKYNNDLPGDMPAADAAAFGFAARRGIDGSGDGNEQLCGSFCAIAGGGNVAGEIALFWNDLSTAGLIAGNYQGIDCGVAANPPCTASSATIPVSSIIPAAKIGGGNYITVYYDPLIQHANVYQIIYITAIDTGGYLVGESQGMTHRQAYLIDSKIDDGYPTTGSVVSKREYIQYSTAPPPGYAAPASWAECGNSDTTPTTYNLANESSGSNSAACSISIQFQ